MKAARNEHTIAVACQVQGRGYWTGKPVTVEMIPAPAGTGIQFARSDLPGSPRASAGVTSRSDAHLRTIVQNGEARFEMIEHVMAALYAMEIDNCLVQIDGVEFPGLDGSAMQYVQALQRCGLIIQARPRRRLVIDRPLRVESGNRWIEATPSQNGVSRFEYRLSFDEDNAIGAQQYSCTLTPDRFVRDVAPARTFVTEQQANALRAQGVASHVTNSELLVFGNAGPIGNELRYKDECARHKVLDMIGDLALSQIDLVGNFVSYRGGHSLNGQLTEQLTRLAASQNHTAQQRYVA